MRAPVPIIPAPAFPAHLPWINTEALRMEDLRGSAVLIEFFDFCRVSSLRTLPYMRAWHERYRRCGLWVIGVHCPGFEPSRDEDAVRAAVRRLEIEHSVLVDSELTVWRLYENAGWPARYVFGPDGMLFHYHYGEGAYAETELAIQQLLGVSRDPCAPLRAEDAPGARLVVPTPAQAGAWSGPYEAGGVWAVLEGRGRLGVNGRELAVDYVGAHALIEHPCHSAGTLELEVGDGVSCHAVCFTAGLAA